MVGSARNQQPWLPGGYTVTPTDAGADVNYQCYCGCDAGFAFKREVADASPEQCCCGNSILVGSDAGARLGRTLEASAAFRLDVRQVQMPWDENVEVALAIPREADA